MKLKKLIGVMAVAGFVLPGAALATNGYFAHGYGVKSQSMGGVGIALPQDALAAATNPAGMAMVGDRLDVGLTWFSPKRTTTESTGMAVPGDSKSGQNNFYVPEFGYNKMLDSNMAVGIAVFGNGGMNTNYNAKLFPGGTTNTYSNLEQLFISPTFAMKVAPNHSIGASLNLIYQTFEAHGLQGFQAMSRYSSNVTDKGKDSSSGYSIKLGWTGMVSSDVTLGATYQSRSNTSKFDDYKGLFAEAGKFDVPETYGFGVAVKATPQLVVAADVVQINYSKVRSLGNTTRLSGLTGGQFMLGDDNGSGFGWDDQTVFKLGMSYEYSKDLTLRAGYNHAKSPVKGDQTFFNILAPATVEDHLTLGGTWKLQNNAELTVSYMHAFNKQITGAQPGSSTEALSALGYPAASHVDLKMNQDSLGVAYGMKF